MIGSYRSAQAVMVNDKTNIVIIVLVTLFPPWLISIIGYATIGSNIIISIQAAQTSLESRCVSMGDFLSRFINTSVTRSVRLVLDHQLHAIADQLHIKLNNIDVLDRWCLVEGGAGRIPTAGITHLYSHSMNLREPNFIHG